MTRGSHWRARTAWDWEVQSILASEEAAACLRSGLTEQAAEWSRLAVVATDAAAIRRLLEKHSPRSHRPT